jgi:leucyl/phenylalanyl-tRNA--protein transferase
VTVYRLDERLVFPAPDEAEPDGLLAVGGDLRPERLLLAYSQGIFPWQGDPPLWFSPDPRMLLVPSELRVSRSLRRLLARGAYELRMDTAFAQVVRGCASAPRPGQRGTWIGRDMRRAYTELHALGFAHSIEAWHDGELAGGLYGVSLGAAFFGESMFARKPDASKVAFAALVRQLERWGCELVDCQVHSAHLASFGASEWPRARFLAALERALEQPTRTGRWRFDGDPLEPWRRPARARS